MEQYHLADNGLISPCPYRENCNAYKLSDGVRPDGTTYTRGCDGNVYFCNSPKEVKND